MNVWFVRSNGDTVHNDPSSPDFVSGEPPVFPETYHNYHDKCLTDGFVRLGWPNTGDLREPGLNRLAVNGYSLQTIEPRYQSYLSQYVRIHTGDLILLPSYTGRKEVHIGVAVIREKRTREIICNRPGLDAYYYFHDVACGEWYECAHRIDVLWDREPDGVFAIHHITGLPWLVAFSPVDKGRDPVIEVAKEVGLPVLG